MKNISLVFGFLAFSWLSPFNVIFDIDGVLVKMCVGKKVCECITRHKADMAREIYKNPVAEFSQDLLRGLNTFNPTLAIFQNQSNLMSEFCLGNKQGTEVFRYLHENKQLVIQKIVEKSGDFFDPIKDATLDLAMQVLFLGACNFYGEEIKFENCLERAPQGVWILNHVVSAEQKVFLFGDTPEEWLAIYKSKFPDIFNLFNQDGERCKQLFSFQCQSLEKKELLDTLYKIHKIVPAECVVVSCHISAVNAAKELGMKAILFNSANGQQAIRELKNIGVLNLEASYFMPVLFDRPIPIIHPEHMA